MAQFRAYGRVKFKNGTLMSRLLFFAAVVAVVYLLLKSYRSRAAGQNAHARTDRAGHAEDMVRCIYCGVHLPKSESILSRGEFFCSDEHRRQHQH